jgi:hypothetical protein
LQSGTIEDYMGSPSYKLAYAISISPYDPAPIQTTTPSPPYGTAPPFDPSASSIAYGNGKIIVSPNFNVWPGMAWATPTVGLSILETKTTSNSHSTGVAYGGNLMGIADVLGAGSFDYICAGLTGTTRANDAAFVAKDQKWV